MFAYLIRSFNYVHAQAKFSWGSSNIINMPATSFKTPITHPFIDHRFFITMFDID